MTRLRLSTFILLVRMARSGERPEFIGATGAIPHGIQLLANLSNDCWWSSNQSQDEQYKNIQRTILKNAAVRPGELRIPHTLPIGEMDEVDSVVKRGKPLQRSDYLFNEGAAFNSYW